MVEGASLERVLAQHARRRASGQPVPTILVGRGAADAWMASWSGRPVVHSNAASIEDAARAYLDMPAVRDALIAVLTIRVAAARAVPEPGPERTAVERNLWLAASRDALVATGDLDGQLLLAGAFSDDSPPSALRSLAAAGRVLGRASPPLHLGLPPAEVGTAIRIALELAEAAPAIPLAVATTSGAWRSWFETPGSEQQKAMVAPYAIELLPPLAELEEASSLLRRAQRTGTNEDDELARAGAKRLLLAALDRDPRARGLFQLNRPVGADPHLLTTDVACASLGIAIEVDGYRHFRESEAYRRDRKKDAALQKQGYFVLHALAEDVVDRLDEVVSAVHDALVHRAKSRPKTTHQ